MVKEIIKDIVNSDFIRGVLSAGVIALGGLSFQKIKEKRKEKQKEFDYIWEPKKPVINDNSDIKNINKHGKDWKMIIEDTGFDIEPNEMISGLEAFKQSLMMLVNTEKGKYEIFSHDHGVSYVLINAEDASEFNSMARVISQEIIQSNKDWITEIYSIKKKKDENIIVISLGVNGVHEIVKVTIPIFPNDNN